MKIGEKIKRFLKKFFGIWCLIEFVGGAILTVTYIANSLFGLGETDPIANIVVIITFILVCLFFGWAAYRLLWKEKSYMKRTGKNIIDDTVLPPKPQAKYNASFSNKVSSLNTDLDNKALNNRNNDAVPYDVNKFAVEVMQYHNSIENNFTQTKEPPVKTCAETVSQIAAPTYVQNGSRINRIDGKEISNEEIPYLIELGEKQAIETAANSPQRSAKEEELSFQFFYKHGGESQRRTDVFEDLNRAAYNENNIDKKIELLQNAIAAYEKAKKWHYNHSKGGMIYFQDMWEYMHNSRSQCFSWDESVRAELDWQLDVRDNIIPWILENAQEGFIQADIYKEFPDENKSDLRKIIDRLVSESHLTKTKKGNSYFINISNTQK